jgi:hypothetical protein
VGLWSRFWSVVPKAVVKSARDTVSKPDTAPSGPTPASESNSILDDGDEVASTEEMDESVAPEVTHDGEPEADAPGPRTRTL